MNNLFHKEGCLCTACVTKRYIYDELGPAQPVDPASNNYTPGPGQHLGTAVITGGSGGSAAACTTQSAQIPESILQEAQRLTHGPRQQDYGHPLDDYTRTAALVSAVLAHKLKSALTAEEMALAMVCVKLSRQIHSPKRDNMVDAAGYAWVAHAIGEERQRRNLQRYAK